MRVRAIFGGMMSNFLTKDIAVLDVNSRTISSIVGVKKAQTVFGIKSIIEKEYSGYSDGQFFDVDEVASVAESVLREVVAESNTKTRKLFIGVPAEFVANITKDVELKFDRTHRITSEDINLLIKQGNDFKDDNYVLINTASVYFALDDNDTLYDEVVGMEAKSIYACVSYMLCNKNFVLMFDEIASKNGFKDTKYVASNFAECIGLLEKEERDNVYVLLDIGYLSSSITVGKGNGILDMKSFSMGGAHIAGDIYEALNVPFESALVAKSLVDLTLNYPQDAVLFSNYESEILALDACDITKARLDVFVDIIDGVLREVEQYAPANMNIYLTGEGVAPIRGAKKYMSEQLAKNIEIIMPKLPGFLKPQDSSKISLLYIADSMSTSVLDSIKRLIFGGRR